MVKGNKLGLTLIELLVSMLLIAIMLAVILPSFTKSLGKSNLYAAARQIVGHIREVQQMTITEGKPSYRMVFHTDPEKNYYLLQDGIKNIKRWDLPPKVYVYDTNINKNNPQEKNKLKFNTNGRPFPTGGTITLKNSKDDLLYVIIAVHSGRVRIDDKPPSQNETS